MSTASSTAKKLLRRLLAIAVVAALFLAAVLAINSARLGSRQLEVGPLPALNMDLGAAAHRLAAAVRIKTISYDDRRAAGTAFPELHDLLVRSFPNAHRVLQREVINGASLLYAWRGSDATQPPLLLLAHQDVVPVAAGTERDWQQEAYAGAIVDGYIWGRGTWDDKGNLLAMMEAVELLATRGLQPRRTIYLAFGHDEEIGGQGARAIAGLLKSRGVRLDFVLDEGLLVTEGMIEGLKTPVALIGIAEKGYLTLDLTTEATPGHSSLPPARTAIGSMSQALTRLEQRQMPAAVRGAARQMFETLAPEYPGINRILLSNLWLFEPLVRRQLEAQPAGRAMLRTTTALTAVHAGDKENTLPGRAEAKVNLRLLPGERAEQAVARSREAIADESVHLATGLSWEASPVSSTESAAYGRLARTIREVFPSAVVAPGLMIAATDSRHFVDIVDHIYRFTPVRVRPEDLSRFHGSNERISLANYGEMIRFYHRLLEVSAFAGQSP